MVNRRLAAIVAADVAGYSRLMHAAEEFTHDRFIRLMSEAIVPRIGEHGGRAVSCAMVLRDRPEFELRLQGNIA